jgi:hypothetical protein
MEYPFSFELVLIELFNFVVKPEEADFFSLDASAELEVERFTVLAKVLVFIILTNYNL